MLLLWHGVSQAAAQRMVAGGLQPPSQQEEAAKEAAKKQGVIFVLENASLETAKVGKVQPQCSPQHTFWTACLLLMPYMLQTRCLRSSCLCETGSHNLHDYGRPQTKEVAAMEELWVTETL